MIRAQTYPAFVARKTGSTPYPVRGMFRVMLQCPGGSLARRHKCGERDPSYPDTF
jgi:hypothetical protein